MSGRTLHWTEWGDARGKPVLFLHGFLGSGADWEETAAQLGANYRCIAVDLPGHGRTPPELAAFPDCVDGLMRVMDAAGVERCPWAGYSMGGRIALYAAAHQPHRISGLVLESASPGLESAVARAERRAADEKLAESLENEALSAFLERWYDQPLFAPLKTHGERFGAVIARRLRNRPGWLAQAMRGLGTGAQPSLWREWPTLDTPTHLIVGALDKKFTAIAETMAARRPATRVTVAPGCGHNVHAEAPTAYARMLRNALDGRCSND